jgi:hypothetical protein
VTRWAQPADQCSGRWRLASRTDFADRQKFEQVLDIARGWIVASGKRHRCNGADRPGSGATGRLAIKSVKQAVSCMAWMPTACWPTCAEQVNHDGDRAKVRTSFTLLDVPLVFEEDLSWFEGDWQDTETVEALKAERANRRNGGLFRTRWRNGKRSRSPTPAAHRRGRNRGGPSGHRARSLQILRGFRQGWRSALAIR